MTSPRLIQLSGVIMDMIYWIDFVPLPGHEAVVHRHALMAGGGFNAMVAARRAGLDVVYAGNLGTGPFADLAADALLAQGIQTLRARKPGLDQGCCTVLIDRNGERSFVAAAGADGVLTDDDLAMLEPHSQDWHLLSGYALTYAGSRDALTRWLRPGIRLVFDPGPLVDGIAARTLQTALAAATWISANRAEASILAGRDDPAKAALVLARDRPVGGAIVRDGANGCFLAVGGKVTHLSGFAVNAVDTNGAGDAHIGAFIAGLALGEDPKRAAHIANVTAALSTLNEGPSTSPTRDAVLAVIVANELPL
jgi:sugar/nucleoside kinase (ribokinase family)